MTPEQIVGLLEAGFEVHKWATGGRPNYWLQAGYDATTYRPIEPERISDLPWKRLERKADDYSDPNWRRKSIWVLKEEK